MAVCPSCGRENPEGSRFCNACGADLASVEPAAREYRKVVSVLFCDIVGSTELGESIDPEALRTRLARYFDEMKTIVERHGGAVEKFIGDAVFAVFGARRAHDDDPLRAALCGLEMTSSLEQVAHDRGEPPLRLRVGIATGEVVASVREVGDRTDLVVTGDTVTTAMRLQELAEPGEILLDEASVRAARQRLEVEVVGEHAIRGRAEPVRVHRLRGERQHRLVGAAGPGLLIGRVADRARLRDALESTHRTGRGRVVVVIGDAGIGKSRLVADMEEEARGLGFAWTWTENLSYTTGEYYAFARTFAQRLADEHGTDSGSFARRLLFTSDIDETTTRRLAGAVAAIARDAEFSGWEAEAALVPADPADIQRSLGELTARYVRRLAETGGPRAVVIDDVHWADRSSRPLLDQLIKIVTDVPFTVFVTTRPGSIPAWAPLAHVELLELSGLDSRGTGRLAASVTGTSLGDETSDWLHERTGGPLFVVETVRALLEDDALVMRDGRLELGDPSGVDRVPVNLRALLGARIDALQPAARAALQVASVIGMSFSPALVSELLGGAPADDALAVLAESSIVDPAEAGGEWRFRHPLIHDVAYAGMLSSRRRELHGRLADSLESGPLPPQIGQLAHHRAASGDRERAVPLLAQAADAALAVGAVTEAAGYWRTAAVLLGDDPRAGEFRARIRELEIAVSPRATRGRFVAVRPHHVARCVWPIRGPTHRSRKSPFL